MPEPRRVSTGQLVYHPTWKTWRAYMTVTGSNKRRPWQCVSIYSWGTIY